MKLRLTNRQLPLLATVAVGLLLFASASIVYRERGFFSAAVFFNLFSDNAVLGITAIGMTFVILSGGIDLSVGAVIGFTSILMAVLIQNHGIHPVLAALIALVLGAAFGGGMGCLIRFYGLPPFLVTLAGMFLARGSGFLLRLESLPITHPFYSSVANVRIPVGADAGISVTAIIFVVALLGALYLAHWTSFGRNVYAVGGNEQSALLMGLPVGSTKVAVYALSGLCAALAGVVNTLYTLTGNATAGTGRELDAIASTVIGGTLLSGGVGYVAGTLVGVLIFGIIQTAIAFQGTLSSWWTKIVIGLLLFVFIILQRIIQTKTLRTR